MRQRALLLTIIVLAAIGAVWFTTSLSLPAVFPGFTYAFAGGWAFIATLALSAFMPTRWIWNENERLEQAFQHRHDLSRAQTKTTLDAISTAHSRASAWRRYAQAMRDDMKTEVANLADRMDAAAHEIFYRPEQLRQLRPLLVRAQLIDDATRAHAALRKRSQPETEARARADLRKAIAAFNSALDKTQLQAARGLLHEVQIASDVAEQLLRPRDAGQNANAPNNF